jgi:HPt (histidine-containing phosphotransfer) domain-containing protein
MMTQINSTIAETAGSQQNLQKIRSDVKIALELVMGDSSAETLNEMSSIFLEDAVPLINQMKDGFSNRNYYAISMAAHALKGSSATIGLEKFADVCLALETSSKQEEDNLLTNNLTLLEAEYTQIRQALSAFLI